MDSLIKRGPIFLPWNHNMMGEGREVPKIEEQDLSLWFFPGNFVNVKDNKV